MAINIEYVDMDLLVVPSWRATYVLRPELLIISGSLMEFGFIQPIHVRRSSNEIIDGSERFLLASNIDDIYEQLDGKIPVVFHDVSQIDAMIMHLRLNRGRSTVVAAKTSEIIRKAKRSGDYRNSDFNELLSMRNEELSLMLDGSVLKARKIKEHNYAKAWVPIEAPSSLPVSDKMVIESPPNPDR
jgi:ParB-like chromosome segregation protein Spo0J